MKLLVPDASMNYVTQGMLLKIETFSSARPYRMHQFLRVKMDFDNRTSEPLLGARETSKLQDFFLQCTVFGLWLFEFCTCPQVRSWVVAHTCNNTLRKMWAQRADWSKNCGFRIATFHDNAWCRACTNFWWCASWVGCTTLPRWSMFLALQIESDEREELYRGSKNLLILKMSSLLIYLCKTHVNDCLTIKSGHIFWNFH